MRSAPLIYEINTWPWLNGLSRKHGRPIHLGNVPAEEWDDAASWGFDAVWLMGVWERSAAGREIAREHPDLQAEYRKALPDFKPDDIVGSPYSIHRYQADPHLGGPEGLRSARAELTRRNLALLLDFVPNHLAVDHPWTSEHPEYFIREDSGRIANGRDPYFPPWTDTAQINAYHSGARAALTDTLQEIARECDGVRCDMAMLLLNEIFKKTWGERAGPPPRDEFWPQAIAAVKAEFAGFTFVAEAYWDLEARMLQLGFDYCYDKRLYDSLVHKNALAVRQHLAGDTVRQEKLVRMIENHDEQRAAAVFPPARERAAAVVAATLPGAKLFYQGELEGRKIRMPVQLARWPEEQIDQDLRNFWWTLLQACGEPVIRDGEWQLLSVTGWPDNTSCVNLLAWGWRDGDERALVAVNYSDSSSQGRIHLPWDDLSGKAWPLRDVLTSEVYVRSGDEMASTGLYVDLGPWRSHFLMFEVGSH